MIKNEEVTFVFQGKFESFSERNIRTIQSNFPKSQIIISCWDNDEIGSALANNNSIKIVRSKDSPPPIIKGARINNINRQLITTQKGVLLAETPYICKIRSDCYLTSGRLLNLYNKLLQYSISPVSFVQKVLIVSLTSHSHMSREKLLFHPCDWIFLGKREDILSLFKTNKLCNNDFHFYSDGQYRTKYRAEQYYYVQHLKSKAIDTITHAYEYNCSLEKMSNELIMSDFIIVEPAMIGLRSSKHPGLWKPRAHVYNFNDWANFNKVKYSCLPFERMYFYLSRNIFLYMRRILNGQ